MEMKSTAKNGAATVTLAPCALTRPVACRKKALHEAVDALRGQLALQHDKKDTLIAKAINCAKASSSPVTVLCDPCTPLGRPHWPPRN